MFLILILFHENAHSRAIQRGKCLYRVRGEKGETKYLASYAHKYISQRRPLPPLITTVKRH